MSEFDANAGPIDAGTNDVGCSTGVCDADVPTLPGGVPPPPVVTPSVSPDPIVLVKRPYTSPAQKIVLLLVDDTGFDGTGTFTVSSAAVRFFLSGVEITSGHVFSGPDLAPGITLSVEGVIPSASMNDIEITLALTPGSRPVNPPAHGRMTCVEVILDIAKSRTALGTDPAILSTAEKTGSPGRIVHVQNSSFRHGRALVIVRKALPNVFGGTLILTPENGEVRIFADPQEVPAGGQTALANPLRIPNGTIPTPGGVRLWAEGAAVSPSLAHSGFRLGVEGVDPDGDRVRVTAVQFSNLTAVVSSTPPNQTRLGNGPVPNHTPLNGGSAASAFDESFTVNTPLVLIENSLPAGQTVHFSVSITPRVPVFWSIQRNRAHGTGDHASIISLSPLSEPSITPLGTDSLTASMSLDAVGSFHVRPFVDCDGGGNFEYNDARGNRIEREPFILGNLVIVRVTCFANNSVCAHS